VLRTRFFGTLQL